MAKYKGVRYIAQRLTKDFNKQYPRYTDALPEAHRVLAQLQDSGKRVNKKTIRSLIVTPKPKLKGQPQLPAEMLMEKDFFMLDDYITYLAISPKNVYFTSKIFPSTIKQPIRGGARYNYEDLFKPFVDYFNKIQNNSTDKANGRYIPDLYLATVKTTPPVKKGKIWVSEIIYETPIDYGWDPKKATVEPPEDLTAEKISEKIKESAATKEEKPPAIPTTNLEQEKIKSAERIKLAEIEAETKRQKNKEKVASAERLFEKGKITLEQYIDLIK